MSGRFANRSGFTLIEFVTVILLLGILFALLLPGLNRRNRGPGRRAICQNNLKQLALASLNHESARQVFPAGVIDHDDDLTDGMHSGFVMLLPFLEQAMLYDQIDLAESWKSERNVEFSKAKMPMFLCLSNQNSSLSRPDNGGIDGGVTDYAFCKGATGYLGNDTQFQNGAFDVNGRVKTKQFTDGTSNTILFGEAASNPSLRAGSPRNFSMGQLWAKADFDGTHGFGNKGGRGSCMAVTGQHPGPDSQWGTDDDLITPIGSSPVVISVDNGDKAVFEHATDRIRGFYAYHEDWVQFAYADGSTHTIPVTVSPEIMILLSVRNDGKPTANLDF